MTTPVTQDYVKILEEKIRRLEIQNVLQSTAPPGNLPQAPTSSRPKPSKPPSYGGDRGESVDTWLKQVERYFRLSDIPEVDQVEWGASFLTKNVASWFEVENQKVETSGEEFTWERFS